MCNIEPMTRSIHVCANSMAINLAGPKISFSLIHAIWSLQCAPGRLLQRQSEPPRSTEHRHWQRNTPIERSCNLKLISSQRRRSRSQRSHKTLKDAHISNNFIEFLSIFLCPDFSGEQAKRSMLQRCRVVYYFHTSARLWREGLICLRIWTHTALSYSQIKSSERLLSV